MTQSYTIAEWFGASFTDLSVEQRQELARAALQRTSPPPCPFQRGTPPCGKRGGVCSIRAGDRLPVITCPRRFDDKNILPLWLGRIVGFSDPFLAREVPFMRSPNTGRPAGRIDLVVSSDDQAHSWYGLEIQAVYFSGSGMNADFEMLLTATDQHPSEPTAVRRPDWHSSSAKRLMPQLQIKAPTLRRWGTKLAVAVDRPFFEALGGPSTKASQDLNDGDVIWLIPGINEKYELRECHWEILSLEESNDKLLSAKTVKRHEFEQSLKSKLWHLTDRSSEINNECIAIAEDRSKKADLVPVAQSGG